MGLRVKTKPCKGRQQPIRWLFVGQLFFVVARLSGGLQSKVPKAKAPRKVPAKIQVICHAHDSSRNAYKDYSKGSCWHSTQLQFPALLGFMKCQPSRAVPVAKGSFSRKALC